MTLNPGYRSAANDFYGTTTTTVTSNDPRLFDTRRNIQTQFEDPPNQSLINPFSVSSTYGPNPHIAKNFYPTYADINAGQIRYYADKDIEKIVFKPLFITPATTVDYDFIDPMGTTKHQYVRVPLIITNPISNPDGIPRQTLSFLEDTTNHREDIMIQQMNRINSQRWTKNRST